METVINQITPDQKEATAIPSIHCMLLTYAEEQHIPFEEAMLSFSQSRTYKDLFDFDTEIWKEGPEYLRCLYEEELNRAPHTINA